MGFQNKSTLVQPATSNFPIRQWLDDRDPVSGVNGDYKNFQIFDIWINSPSNTAWIMVDRTATSGTWIQMASTGTGILTVTGDVGGAVGPDGANNINLLSGSDLTVTGNPAGNTLTITLDGTVATQYDADVGSAVPAAGILNIVGTGGASTSAAGNTVTITTAATVPLQFDTDAGSAVPALGILDVLGGTGITTAGAGNVVTITADADVATQYTTDAGVAVPAANNLNVVGGGATSTTGAGSTITITSTGGGMVWNVISVVGPTSMSVDNGYIANVASPSVCGLTLPLTSAVGSVICVTGMNTGGWSIAQNAGQSIRLVDSVTTVGVGGSVASSAANASICMVCVVADTDWVGYSATGNLIFT
jgi:hypothetical protein